MKGNTPRGVLVVAPGHGGRGGIDSVVRMHQAMPAWSAMHCRLFPTYDDRGAAWKMLAALRAYTLAPFALARTGIVHVHLAGETSLLRKLPILVLARALDRKIILHVHASSEESLFVHTPEWAWRRAFATADQVIALSAGWAAILRRRLPDAQVMVIPNPVPWISETIGEAVRPATLSERPKMTRVLYVGKVEPRKGYATLLAAAARILSLYPSVEFWFGGHGELEQASAKAAALGISGQVRLLGWLGPHALAEAYAAADIFCLPSFGEGVPMAMLEAMSHGLPVITTPVGGIPDVITHGENGLLFEAGDVEGLTGVLLRLLTDPDYAERLAEAGRCTVRNQCSPVHVSHALAALYAELGTPGLGLLGAEDAL